MTLWRTQELKASIEEFKVKLCTETVSASTKKALKKVSDRYNAMKKALTSTQERLKSITDLIQLRNYEKDQVANSASAKKAHFLNEAMRKEKERR